jgi:peptide/nickel transport system ATP-binding protein
LKKENILIVKNLKKWFPVKRGLFAETNYIKAVDGISFEIKRGEILGLVGESGCGKTTTGKLVLNLIDKTNGSIFFKNQDIFGLNNEELRRLRQKMQIIFQNPFEILETRLNVLKQLSLPLEFNNLVDNENEKMNKVKEILSDVDLKPPEDFIFKFPPDLSGGQLQRIAIARSLILQPEFVVADEPVSMLDVSIRAGILKLLLELKKDLGLTYLYISHDLAISKFFCDRIAVMYLGKIVEIGPSEKVMNDPLHPYTMALRSVLPVLDPNRKHFLEVSKVIQGEIPNPMDIPQGCRFHPRCPHRMKICSKTEPILTENKARLVACHLYESS